jgi:hypothetical protein
MFLQGQVTGVIFVGLSTPKPFTDSQIEFLKTFADQAVITIENVRKVKGPPYTAQSGPSPWSVRPHSRHECQSH